MEQSVAAPAKLANDMWHTLFRLGRPVMRLILDILPEYERDPSPGRKTAPFVSFKSGITPKERKSQESYITVYFGPQNANAELWMLIWISSSM